MAETPRGIVGLTGNAATGKDTVAELFERVGFYHVSSSDILREHIALTGLANSRSLQTRIANDIRQHNGDSFLVDKSLDRAESYSEPGQPILISGIYAPGEAQHVLSKGGVLVEVYTGDDEEDIDARYRRLAERNDATRDKMTRQEFVEAHIRENGGEVSCQANVFATRALVHYRIRNDGSLADLESRVTEITDILLDDTKAGRLFSVSTYLASRGEGMDAEPAIIAAADTDQKSIFGGIISKYIDAQETLPPPERLDTFDEVYRLEVKARALEYIRQSFALSDLDPKNRALAPLISPRHSVEHIGNQFAKKIMPAFLDPNVEMGLSSFRSIQPQTTDQEMVLLTNDDEFRALHAGLQDDLAGRVGEMTAEVTQRLDAKDGPIAKNDRLQFRGMETDKSLENILSLGVEIRVEPDSVAAIAEAYVKCGSGTIPVTEAVKNLRIMNINGFGDSKIATAVHDVMDHAWTFNLLREEGLLGAYAKLFETIGSPHLTNIFLREGEAIASIAYGVRYWGMVEHGFKPMYRAGDLRQQMDDMFDSKQLTDPRHHAAYRIIRKLDKDPASREWQCLGFSFSNYMAELDEQRRKHGKIKQRDPSTNRVVGELDPFSPDFLSLFITAHHEILNSDNKHRNDLFTFHIMLEEYLSGIGAGEIPVDKPLAIKVQDLRTVDVSQTTVNPERLHWMFRNYGFTSVKDSIY